MQNLLCSLFSYTYAPLTGACDSSAVFLSQHTGAALKFTKVESIDSLLCFFPAEGRGRQQACAGCRTNRLQI